MLYRVVVILGCLCAMTAQLCAEDISSQPVPAVEVTAEFGGGYLAAFGLGYNIDRSIGLGVGMGMDIGGSESVGIEIVHPVLFNLHLYSVFHFMRLDSFFFDLKMQLGCDFIRVDDLSRQAFDAALVLMTGVGCFYVSASMAAVFAAQFAFVPSLGLGIMIRL